MELRASETGRDIFFFLVAIITLLVYAIFFKKITMVMALSFPVIYVIFIIVVVYGEHKRNKNNQDKDY